MKQLFFLSLGCLLAMTACSELEARGEAYAGRDALLDCQFEDAVTHFQSAHKVLTYHEDVTLGFAISEFLSIMNSPDVADIFRQIGFTQTPQEFCLNNIDQIKNRNDHDADADDYNADADNCCSKESIHNISITIPHPCSDVVGDCQLYDYISNELEWMHIIQAMKSHRTEFEHVVSLLTKEADHLEKPINIDIGSIVLTVHAADLYFMSAMMELALFATDVISQYDAAFSVAGTIHDVDCEKHALYLNEHVGMATDSPEDAAAIPYLLDALLHIKSAFSNALILRTASDASDEPCVTRNSILNWNGVPYGVMNNIIAFTDSFREEPYTIRDIFIPDVTVDLKKLLTSLPVRSATEPLFSCTENGLSANGKVYIEAINSACSPMVLNPNTTSFELHPDLNYRLSSGWRRWTPADLF